MPTQQELAKEAAWRAQYVPQNLLKLADDIRRISRLEVKDVGTYGDHRHLKGYHRSRRWIHESEHCTNRRYSITETTGNRLGGDSNWISGIDIGGSEGQARTIHARLNIAKAGGKLPQIRQVILENDPWHVHISIDREHANDDHAKLLQIITGTTPRETKMVTINVTLPVLKEGSQGLDVATVQALLNARGFDTKIDGDFGLHTEAQTKHMQKAFGAEHIDGIWGPETWAIGIVRKDIY